MAVLTKDDILKASDCSVEPLDVPEWGGRIYLRLWSAADLDAFEKSVLGNQQHDDNKRAIVASLSICDADGNRLFSPEDVEELGKKSATALDRVLLRAVEMNRMTVAAQEELEKN